MKKDAYYFPHDANAQNDEKCLFLISKYGMAGYGLYWCFIEAMHEQVDGKLTVALLEGFSIRFKVEKDMLFNFYQDAITVGLFVTDGVKYWSNRVIKNKEEFDRKRLRKSHAGKLGMQARWGLDNTDITEDNKGKERKEKEKKDNIRVIVAYLNEKTGRNFKPDTSTTEKLLSGRLNDYTVEDCKKVIDTKTRQWLNDPKMSKYLSPDTLFAPSKFEKYLNESNTVQNTQSVYL